MVEWVEQESNPSSWEIFFGFVKKIEVEKPCAFLEYNKGTIKDDRFGITRQRICNKGT